MGSRVAVGARRVAGLELPAEREERSDDEDEGAEDSEEEAAAAEGDDKPGGPQPRRDKPLADNENVYKPYVRAFDEEVDAEDLCDSEELARLRQQLDQQLQHLLSVLIQQRITLL
jgi:cobaltochelatase CobT